MDDAPSTSAAAASGVGTEPVPTPGRGWGLTVLLLVVIVGSVAVMAVALISLTDRGHDAETVTYVVPEGTAEDLIEGRKVEIMPSEVDLRVGDTLVIRNDDTETASVGPFTVRAGETLRQTFRRPQTLIGECTLSGSGEVRIVVT